MLCLEELYEMIDQRQAETECACRECKKTVAVGESLLSIEADVERGNEEPLDFCSFECFDKYFADFGADDYDE